MINERAANVFAGAQVLEKQLFSAMRPVAKRLFS
jgi:hypothetical protein